MAKKNGYANYSSAFTTKALGLVDRERETKQLMYALLTREHMLLMGPAGTAKSQFATNAFSTIDNSRLFGIHLTKQTTEEYVYGPLNISELKNGNLVHNTTGSILDADFAFLDEFFDASDVLLRSLLGVLNERKWMKGGQQIQAKLHTAIVTSNYQRENDVTQAVLDRIIFKTDIQPITAKNKRIQVYSDYLDRPDFVPTKLIDMAKLQEFADLVEKPDSVKFKKEILDAYDNLVTEFAKESKKYISQRTANKALKVIKASALLNDRDSVAYEDLEELRYVFCVLNKRIEEEIFDAVFERCVGKVEEERSVIDDLNSIKEKIDSMPNDFSNLPDAEFISKMRELNEYSQLIQKMASPTNKVATTKNELTERIRVLVSENRDKLFRKNSIPEIQGSGYTAENGVIEGDIL
jgi:MoxR-like ATPase